jgi:glutamine---fructose-6-phosphate transaminase (isomerizing)
MCGIFGVACAGTSEDPAGFHRFAGSVSSFLRRTEVGLQTIGDSIASLAESLGGVLEESYALVRAPGFLQLVQDEASQQFARDVLPKVREVAGRLESIVEQRGACGQQGSESLNGLITNLRDLAWRLEFDALKNLDLARGLLGGGNGAPPSAWNHAWQINLALNNLDRLEVRGRDSAGIAVYARFPSAPELDSFLSRFGGGHEDLLGRSKVAAFAHGAVLRPSREPGCLLFAFKIAEEVGELGFNVRSLREAVAKDELFQAVLRHPGVAIQLLAHTRWASNGVISQANCHPVDSAVRGTNQELAGSTGGMVAVLNGDVDNYQDLLQRYVRAKGLAIDPAITTDAKIIPVVVDHHYRECGRLDEAFRRAFGEFEGSMAIGLMAADHPGQFFFAQKGSGQGLFFGLAGGAVTVASEMYGLVEVGAKYVKSEGERSPAGEVFRTLAETGGASLSILEPHGWSPVPAGRVRTAEITTRDINRAGYPRFLLKEISESVDSVRKTLRGKWTTDATGSTRFRLGPDALPRSLVERLRAGSIRRIVALGQGTAAIAAEGVAWQLRRALEGAPFPLEISSAKATEVSGHYLRRDMSDTAVVAVSQSGTTTDTNRTVDLLKKRGATVLAIVNRRNSDLVYKADGVLYTSDGRDIEMSVASTKAFYSQNVAGAVLALALAGELGTMTEEDLARQANLLLELPDAMGRTLELSGTIAELAATHALRRAYWAVVGSGPGKIAADEIRIKLSELCYKSIASDFLEDKKHIDLSAEPMVIVCASGAPGSTMSDLVKEVAIFRAHRSLPVVIADQGEERFSPYAAGVIHVPRYEGTLSYLLPTMVGHLFGYHAATSLDRMASLLRSIRAGVTAQLAHRPKDDPAVASALTAIATLPANLISEVVHFENLLNNGSVDSGLRPATAVRLTVLFKFLLGKVSADDLARQVRVSSGSDLPDLAVRVLTEAIDELARPIDAIKHQAKTVTVGISRLEPEKVEGPLWKELRRLGAPLGDLSPSLHNFVTAFEQVLSEVRGATLYRVIGLDAAGRPRPESLVQVERKTGLAAAMVSRSERPTSLLGTKWGVVKSRKPHVGFGQNDGRRIVILPLVGDRPEGRLALFHVEVGNGIERQIRLRALAALEDRLDQIRISVTERGLRWDDRQIDCLGNDALFFGPVDTVAAEIERHGQD